MAKRIIKEYEIMIGVVRQNGNYVSARIPVPAGYEVQEEDDAANKSYTVEVIKNGKLINTYNSSGKTSMTNQEYIDEKKEIMGTVITDFNDGTIDKIANKKGV